MQITLRQFLASIDQKKEMLVQKDKEIEKIQTDLANKEKELSLTNVMFEK